MSASARRLCGALGYAFANPGLLEEALTHRSAAGRNNERLEFLGDSLLDAVIAAELFGRYPRASEGELSRLRASLVKGPTLAELARRLQLGECLRLGPGEMKTGGSRRTSILADALEALFGAVYLDGGFAACRDLILNLYREPLAALPAVDALTDPKTRLQEYLQARRQARPEYRVVEVNGEPHAQRFTVACNADAVHTIAVGTSRRKAEQEAARKALELLR